MYKIILVVNKIPLKTWFFDDDAWHILFSRHAYVTALQKLGWRKVAALTQDGAKYSDYMSELQDKFQKNNIEFIMNRKFPKEAMDMRMVNI